MVGEFIVLDTNAIQNLYAGGGTAAWDQLLTGGKNVVLSSVINAEMRGAPEEIVEVFDTWRLSKGIPLVNFEIEGIRFPDDHPRAGQLRPDAGDNVLRALMDHQNNLAAVDALQNAGIDTSGSLRLLTDDADFLRKVWNETGNFSNDGLKAKGHATEPYRGTAEFMAERYTLGDIDKVGFRAWLDGFKASGRELSDGLNDGAGGRRFKLQAQFDLLHGNPDILDGGDGTDIAVFAGLSTSYSITTVNGNIQIVDNAPSQDGDDGTDTLIGIEIAEFKNGVQIGLAAPIILDLDGTGVTTLSAAVSHARYDMDGDGFRDKTSWMGAGEGLLFLDRDGDGTLTDAGEFSFVHDIPGAASDLVGLRAFDSNGDGMLSVDDTRFAGFGIWQDRNGDGVVDNGEIMTLNAAGVQSINLTGSTHEGSFAIGDAVIVNTGSYTRTDGSTADFIDTVLTYFSAATTSVTMLSETADIPSVIDPFAAAEELVAALQNDTRNSLGNHIGQYPGTIKDLQSGSVFHPLSPDENRAANVAHRPASTSVNQLAAAMASEMVSFGVQTTGDANSTWKQESLHPLDFAA